MTDVTCHSPECLQVGNDTALLEVVRDHSRPRGEAGLDVGGHCEAWRGGRGGAA